MTPYSGLHLVLMFCVGVLVGFVVGMIAQPRRGGPDGEVEP